MLKTHLNFFEAIEAMADISYRSHGYYTDSKKSTYNVMQKACQLQIFYNIEGTHTVIIGNETHITKPGDLIIISDWQIHKILLNDENSRYNIIQYDPGLFMKSELLTPHFDRTVTFIRKYKNIVFHTNRRFDNKIRKLFDKYDGHSGFGLEVLRFSTFTMLIETICQFIEQSGITAPEHTPTLTESVADYINLHFNEDIKLQDISRAINISKEHLAAIFKKDTGFTPKQYIDYRRINLSMIILRDPEMTVKDAYEASGYMTYSSFYRAFIKHNDQNPDEYRRNYNNHMEQFYSKKFLDKLNNEIPEEFR